MASATSNDPITSSPDEASKSKRQELSFAERIKVIHARESGKSMRKLADQFGCGKTQILNIISQKDSLLKEWKEKSGVSNPYISSRKRRPRITGNEEINTKVWAWYITETAKSNNGDEYRQNVTGSMIQQEALRIASELGISNFAASNGWLDHFRRVHNIVIYFYYYILKLNFPLKRKVEDYKIVDLLFFVFLKNSDMRPFLELGSFIFLEISGYLKK